MQEARQSRLVEYSFTITLFLIALAFTLSFRPVLWSVAAAPFLLAIFLVARRGRLGPTLLTAVLSGFALAFFFLLPDAGQNLLQVAVNSIIMIVVALVVVRVYEQIKETERSRARLEGIQLTASTMADRLGTSLAIAAGTMEYVEDLPDLPADLRKLITTARIRLFAAGEDLEKLQRVSRVEVMNTTLGEMLDLDRSTDWKVPVEEAVERRVG